MSRSFYSYFKESMNAAGVPCPDELAATFLSVGVATANIAAMTAAITKLGVTATVAELFTASGIALATDVVIVIGAMSAAYYLGALIGALAYASGQALRDLTSTNSFQQMHTMTAAGLHFTQKDMVQMLS
jgi:hypothetical protein